MEGLFSRLLWPIMIVCALAYGSYLFWGTVIDAANRAEEFDVTFSYYRDGRGHHVKGILLVPSMCHQLDVRARSVGARRYHLEFTTQETSSGCVLDPDPRAFAILVPGTDDEEIFTASLDGEPLTLTMVKVEPENY